MNSGEHARCPGASAARARRRSAGSATPTVMPYSRGPNAANAAAEVARGPGDETAADADGGATQEHAGAGAVHDAPSDWARHAPPVSHQTYRRGGIYDESVMSAVPRDTHPLQRTPWATLSALRSGCSPPATSRCATRRRPSATCGRCSTRSSWRASTGSCSRRSSSARSAPSRTSCSCSRRCCRGCGSTARSRDSTRAFLKDAKLVRSTKIPRTIWVNRIVLSKGIEFLLALPVLALFAIVFGAPGAAGSSCCSRSRSCCRRSSPPGVALIVAPLVVFFRDLERAVKLVLRFLFYASPIIYGVTEPAARNCTSGRPSTR